ncbi:Ependymin [Labeo rohita]|uniref:Ependymin n=1 Tax=Labeo rohita TaxID=84645 RepID=A0ABQ8MQ70_LABRO|nr:Ependymin [Labeo rohita]
MSFTTIDQWNNESGGHDLASGEFSYDSKANKFRFVEDTAHANKTSYMDVLIHFEEGVLYEIDSKNESCKKETLQFRKHLMEIPPDATHEAEIYMGSPSITEQGLRVRLTTLCQPLPVAVCRSLAPTMVRRTTFSSVSLELKQKLMTHKFLCPPAYCEGVAFEEAPDDHSLFDLFHD